jgi:hypothetical protein
MELSECLIVVCYVYPVSLASTLLISSIVLFRRNGIKDDALSGKSSRALFRIIWCLQAFLSLLLV